MLTHTLLTKNRLTDKVEELNAELDDMLEVRSYKKEMSAFPLFLQILANSCTITHPPTLPPSLPPSLP